MSAVECGTIRYSGWKMNLNLRRMHVVSCFWKKSCHYIGRKDLIRSSAIEVKMRIVNAGTIWEGMLAFWTVKSASESHLVDRASHHKLDMLRTHLHRYALYPLNSSCRCQVQRCVNPSRHETQKKRISLISELRKDKWLFTIPFLIPESWPKLDHTQPKFMLNCSCSHLRHQKYAHVRGLGFELPIRPP